MSINYSAQFQRNTTSMAFSLPINLLEKINEIVLKDRRFKNRSDFAKKIFSDFVKKYDTQQLGVT